MGYKTAVVTRKDRCDQMPGNKKSQEEMKGGGETKDALYNMGGQG